MSNIEPDDESLKILRRSKEYIELDKFIRIRINNLREESIESLRNPNTEYNAKITAYQSFILLDLLDELDKYNKDDEDDK